MEGHGRSTDWSQGWGRHPSFFFVLLCRRMRSSLEMLEVDRTQLEEVVRRAEQALDDKDATFIRRVFESYLYVSDLVEDKNTTIRRLRELFFGKRTEKTKAVVERHAEETESAADDAAPDSA